MQVLGRQVALGEDEEAPEDPGAVGESTINHLDENPGMFQILLFRSTRRSAWLGQWTLFGSGNGPTNQYVKNSQNTSQNV